MIKQIKNKLIKLLGGYTYNPNYTIYGLDPKQIIDKVESDPKQLFKIVYECRKPDGDTLEIYSCNIVDSTKLKPKDKNYINYSFYCIQCRLCYRKH